MSNNKDIRLELCYSHDDELNFALVDSSGETLLDTRYKSQDECRKFILGNCTFDKFVDEILEYIDCGSVLRQEQRCELIAELKKVGLDAR